MKNNFVKKIVKNGLEKFGDNMDNKICPLILYQPRSAEKHDISNSNIEQKEK